MTLTAENSMRGAALERKNWIHVRRPEAGPKVAPILSVVETAKRLWLPVRDYLLDVLPEMDGGKVSAATHDAASLGGGQKTRVGVMDGVEATLTLLLIIILSAGVH